MAEKKKVTLMLLKVDLECSKCYKKVKKILCKFPQIQDQEYDVKNNTVRIKVVCCSPEKIRDKICCKGRGTIKSIEILKPPEKPPPKPAEKPPPKQAEKPPPKQAEKPKADPPKPAADPPKPAADPPKPAAGPPKPAADPPKPAAGPPKPAADPPKPAAGPPKPAADPPKPKPPAPAPQPVPIGFCCTECSEGRGGGPCYNPCYGQPVRYYDGYCGRPVYDSWGGGGYRGNYGSPCSEYYFNEDNSQGCTIM